MDFLDYSHPYPAPRDGGTYSLPYTRNTYHYGLDMSPYFAYGREAAVPYYEKEGSPTSVGKDVSYHPPSTVGQEKSLGIHNKTLGTPEKGHGTPENSKLTPEKSFGTPEKSFETPEKSYGTPEKPLITPEKSASDMSNAQRKDDPFHPSHHLPHPIHQPGVPAPYLGREREEGFLPYDADKEGHHLQEMNIEYHIILFILN